ncbi:MAG: hypothetical protein A3K77_07520 [Euryarchaeota archaeon RBG_13_31_8]|nr:MAG: hypothetical protein A3K77_07520 [Euryarchaeota archaeon RBG_13_31_8]
MYAKETKKKVLNFIREKKKTYLSELIRLGTEQNKISQQSLNEILADLEKEDKIKILKIAGVKLIEYKNNL